MQFPPFAILPANMTSLSSNYHIGKMGLKYHFGADPWAAQWSDAPLYAKAPAGAPPIAYKAGWSFEGGSRLWLSRGRFQWDASAIPDEIATGDPNILISSSPTTASTDFPGNYLAVLTARGECS